MTHRPIPTINATRLPALTRTPTGLLVMLHGYGSHSGDMVSQLSGMRSLFPQLALIAPDGPFATGRGTQCWFPISEFSGPALTRSAEEVRPHLQNFLERELEALGLSPQQLVLAGFSQGGIMALHTGLHSPHKLAGILAFAGFLPSPENLGPTNGTPVTLIQGDRDQVVPLFAVQKTASALSKAGIPVDFHRLPQVGHTVGPESLEIAFKQLRKMIPGLP